VSAEPDVRFLLANERTFLAYVRTGLALQIAGLGVLQFLTQAPDAVRLPLGAAMVVLGSVLSLTGQRRWRRNDAAIRSGEDLPPVRTARVVSVLVAVVPALAAVVLVVLALAETS
jgi:putative membrane protein